MFFLLCGKHGIETISRLWLDLDKISSSRLGTGQRACAASDFVAARIQQNNQGIKPLVTGLVITVNFVVSLN